jgi:hypothetical protein
MFKYHAGVTRGGTQVVGLLFSILNDLRNTFRLDDLELIPSEEHLIANFPRVLNVVSRRCSYFEPPLLCFTVPQGVGA